MGSIASVVLNNSTRSYDKEYHYRIPETLAGLIKPGVRVIVPFGRGDKSREGYVLNVLNSSEMTELKEIKRVLDTEPVLREDLIKLAKWMKKRYICTYSSAIRCMLPAGINVKSVKIVKLSGENEPRELPAGSDAIIALLEKSEGQCEYNELRRQYTHPDFLKVFKQLQRMGIVDVTEEYKPLVREKIARAAFLKASPEEISDLIENDRIKSIQQIRALEILMDNGYELIQDLMHFAGISYSVINTLYKNGLIDIRDVEIERNPFEENIEKSEPLKPTDEQQFILDKLISCSREDSFREILLHGITGSGKTEVYMQFIECAISKGKTAIVLVPEISLTPQVIKRFRSRFGESIAVLHSRLSLGERYDQWRLIKSGKIKVVVGVRSAVFAPLENLGAIIIDEEHEPTYKSETTPKYDARDVARARCMENRAILVLGSATPSLETYTLAQAGKIELLKMTKRPNDYDLPDVEIIDMRQELGSGNRSIFSRKLEDAIKANVEAGHQTILFLNRRGNANFVLCRNCGVVIKCPKCNISLTYHSYNNRLICHYCGFTVKVPQDCPVCRSPHIRFFGIGTQKVEEELKKHFGDITFLRMDTDTTLRKNAHEKILKNFEENNINILLGTQMIAKGLDFPNVTLIGVLAADILLNVDDYRASERTFQLVTQVAGRAGRGPNRGKVLVQTYNTDDYSIQAACKQDYEGFYRQEILVRKNLNYPPFTNIGVVIVKGLDDKLVQQKIKEVYDKIQDMVSDSRPDFGAIGPMRAPISRINGRYRWRIIVKCRSYSFLVNLFTKVYDDFIAGKERGKVDLSVDINPINML